MKSTVLPILLILFLWVFFAWVVDRKARHQHRSLPLWGIAGILFGPFAWIALLLIGSKHTAEAVPLPQKEHDDPYHDLYTIRQMYTKGCISQADYEQHTQRLLRKL